MYLQKFQLWGILVCTWKRMLCSNLVQRLLNFGNNGKTETRGKKSMGIFFTSSYRKHFELTVTSAQNLACNLQFNLVCGDQTMYLIIIVLAFFYEIITNTWGTLYNWSPIDPHLKWAQQSHRLGVCEHFQHANSQNTAELMGIESHA